MKTSDDCELEHSKQEVEENVLRYFIVCDSYKIRKSDLKEGEPL